MLIKQIILNKKNPNKVQFHSIRNEVLIMIRKTLYLCEMCKKHFDEPNVFKGNHCEYNVCPHCNSKWITQPCFINSR